MEDRFIVKESTPELDINKILTILKEIKMLKELINQSIFIEYVFNATSLIIPAYFRISKLLLIPATRKSRSATSAKVPITFYT